MMMNLRLLGSALIFLAPLSSTATSPGLEKRQECAASYTQCTPSGATSTNVPDIGSGLSSIYVDLLHSINGITARKRDVAEAIDSVLNARSTPGLCCEDGTACLLLQGYNIPFCYDRFTTNFFLPDGSYGTIDDGNYTSTDGSHLNLLTGAYTLANGTTGNVYGSSNSPEVPNTSTLTLPIPYTSSGVGSAIPASDLGVEATYTVTVPATTIMPTTVPPEVVSPVVLGSSTIPTVTTDPATTLQGTTIPATTYTVTSYINQMTSTSSSTGVAAARTAHPALDIGLGALGLVAVMLGV